MNPKTLFSLIVFAVGASACSTVDSIRTSDESKRATAQTTAFWDDYFKLHPQTLVSSSPQELTDLVAEWNKTDHYNGHPAPDENYSEVSGDIEAALKQIPKSVFDLMKNKFFGVFVARDLGCTALGITIYDGLDHPTGGLILVDAKRIHQTANGWQTEHQNLFFDIKKGKLEGTIASQKANTHITALRWILSHELGHLISGFYPNLNDFRTLSWLPGSSEQPLSRFEDNFPHRPEIQNVRAGAKLFREDDFLPIYHGLEQTNFPTLYAAANRFEDFSESLAAYIDVVIYHEPYKVKYTLNGKLKKTFESCFVKKTCPDKMDYFKKLLTVHEL